mmetsp:Transcript_39837/g.119213  ORF Transcript_39837/g.119213 Transcript_39837/m.119213 type:complete len:364 (-) Transcript_39837:108-1199(-)
MRECGGTGAAMVLAGTEEDEAANAWSGVLSIRTLAGTEYVLKDLAPTTSVAEVLQQLGRLLNAVPLTLHLLLGHRKLEPGLGLFEAGLTVEGVSAVVIRRELDADAVEKLFAELCHAMSRRDGKKSRELIDLGAGFDAEGSLLKNRGCTMLNLAIRERLADLALHVISKGADIEVEGDNRRRPLAQAVLMRLENVAEALLDARADPEVRDHNGSSALDYAVRQHNDKLSARLLTGRSLAEQEHAFRGVAPSLNGLEIHAKDLPFLGSHWQPLLVCCASGMPLAASALLEAGAESCCSDEQGRSALHYAHARGLDALVAELVARGADESEADHEGWLPQDGVRSHAAPAVLSRPRQWCRLRWFS